MMSAAVCAWRCPASTPTAAAIDNTGSRGRPTPTDHLPPDPPTPVPMGGTLPDPEYR